MRTVVILAFIFTPLILTPICAADEQIRTAAPSRELHPETWPASTAGRDEVEGRATAFYEFSDVQLSKIIAWIEWFRFDVPVSIDGSISGWVAVESLGSNWLSVGNYRLEGNLQSNALMLSDWTISNATLRFGVSEGNWYVSRIAGSAKKEEKEIGRLFAHAKIGFQKNNRILMEGNLDGVELTPFLEFLLPIANLSGTVEATEFSLDIPLNSASDLKTWSASVLLKNLIVSTAQSWALNNAENASATQLTSMAERSTLVLDNGQWRLDETKIALAEQKFTVGAFGEIAASYSFRVNFQSDQVKLQSALLSTGFGESLNLGGDAEIQAHLEGDAVVGIKNADVSLTSKEISVGELTVNGIELLAKLRGNSLSLVCQNSRFASGVVKAVVNWNDWRKASVFPQKLHLDVTGIDLAQLHAISPSKLQASGLADIQLRFDQQDPQEPRRDVLTTSAPPHSSWTTEARVSLRRNRLCNVPLNDFLIEIAKPIDNEYLRARCFSPDNRVDIEFQARVPEILDTDVQWQKILTDCSVHFDLVDFGLLVPKNLFSNPGERGPHEKLQVSASGNGWAKGESISDWTHGSADLETLSVNAGVSQIDLQDVLLQFSKDEIRLSRFKLSIPNNNSSIVGSAAFPRSQREEKAQVSRLNLRVNEWCLNSIGNWAHELSSGTVSQDVIGGTIDGRLRLNKTGSVWDWKQGWDGSLEGSLANFELRKAAIGDLSLKATITQGQLSAILGGDVFEGQLDCELSALRFANKIEVGQVNLSIRGVQIGKMLPVLTDADSRRFQGSLNLDASTTGGPLPSTVWKISSSIPRLISDGRVLANSLQTRLTFSDARIRIQKLTGGLAEGSIDAVGFLELPRTDRAASQIIGRIDVAGSELELATLLTSIAPDLAKNVKGTASFRGAIVGGRHITFTGPVAIRRGEIQRIPIQELQGNVRAELLSNGRGFVVKSNNLRGTALGGRVEAALSLRNGSSTQMNSKLRLHDACMDQMSKALGFNHIVGTGRFDLDSRIVAKRLRTIADLNGELHFEFGNGDAQSFPIVGDLGQFAPAIRLSSTQIRSGILDAKIGGGQLRIVDLVLDGSAFWLVADGSVGLNSGRLDLTSVLHTGGGLTEDIAADRGGALLATFLPQTLILTELNRLINNRTIFFHIGGTANKPVIQPRLTQTLARLLVQRVRRQILVTPNATTSAAFNEN